MTSITPITALKSELPATPLPQVNEAARTADRAVPGHVDFAHAIRAAKPAAARALEAKSVGREFEAVALTDFVEHMLPDDESIVWGGQAGKLWRGVFAQHLASEVAASGGIGIADIINSMLDEQKGPAS